jgi:hypothetical protein
VNIDWSALLLVSVVTVGVATVVVTIFAYGAAKLAAAHQAQTEGRPAGWNAVLAKIMFGTVGAIGLFGLYLVIPYFH